MSACVSYSSSTSTVNNPRSLRAIGRGESATMQSRMDPYSQLKLSYGSSVNESIEAFIRRNPYLLPEVLGAPSRINKLFGKVPLRLRFSHYNGESPNTLFIVIKTSLSVEEAMDKEDTLMEEWYLNLPVVVRTHLHFATESSGV